MINLECFLCRIASAIDLKEDEGGRLHFICKHCNTKNKLRRRERGDPPFVVTGIETDPEA